MKKRGQITIFILVAIIILVVGILIYFLYPKINGDVSVTENPSLFMQSCVEDTLKDNVAEISMQGGSISPEHYILYKGDKIEYLCYTNEYYKKCVMQQPLLKKHIENEIKSSIDTVVYSCLDDLKKSYSKKGYEVSLTQGDFSVELFPKKIKLRINKTLTLKKQDTKIYNSLNVVLNNNLYELVSIAQNILNWEAHYGDAETTIYMTYYRNIKVEKKKQSDGSTIYILTDRNTGDKFQFASRSIAWPPGYANVQ